ncbi:hypothetical protein D3C76_1811760 [compost metagenome]
MLLPDLFSVAMVFASFFAKSAGTNVILFTVGSNRMAVVFPVSASLSSSIVLEIYLFPKSLTLICFPPADAITWKS